jgi:hypothetical protein
MNKIIPHKPNCLIYFDATSRWNYSTSKNHTETICDCNENYTIKASYYKYQVIPYLTNNNSNAINIVSTPTIHHFAYTKKNDDVYRISDKFSAWIDDERYITSDGEIRNVKEFAQTCDRDDRIPLLSEIEKLKQENIILREKLNDIMAVINRK